MTFVTGRKPLSFNEAAAASTYQPLDSVARPVNMQYSFLPFNYSSMPVINYSMPLFNCSPSIFSSNERTDVKPVKGGKLFDYTGSSQAIKRAAINAGCYADKNSYVPKRGDIAIWSKSASKGHVGIVTKVYPDGSFDVIEGNSSNRVKKNHYKSVSSVGKSFAGFAKMTEWGGAERAERAAQVAEKELAKGVHETAKNDSADIRRYKHGARNSSEWCGYFTSYCFNDGQGLVA